MVTPSLVWKHWGGWLIALALGILLQELSAILAPFIMALILAYLLNPLVKRLESWRISRGIGCLIALVLVVAMIAGLILLLTPLVQLQFTAMLNQMPEYWVRAQESIVPITHRLTALLGHNLSPDLLEKQQAGAQEQASGALNTVGQMAKNIGGRLLNGGLALLNMLSLLIITPVVSFYLLRDWPLMLRQLDRLLPPNKEKEIKQLLMDVDATLAGFLRGQGSVCLALAAYYSLSLSVVGLQSGLLVGLLSGILAFMPYIGTLTGGFFALSLAWLQTGDWHLPLTVLILLVIGQLLEGYVLTPKLVGGRVGLHPVWIIFALMAGGALAGFVGVLIAVPFAAVVGVVVRHELAKRFAPAKPPL
jgi:predicted PurR-regulated permease PerM